MIGSQVGIGRWPFNYQGDGIQERSFSACTGGSVHTGFEGSNCTAELLACDCMGPQEILLDDMVLCALHNILVQGFQHWHKAF